MLANVEVVVASLIMPLKTHLQKQEKEPWLHGVAQGLDGCTLHRRYDRFRMECCYHILACDCDTANKPKQSALEDPEGYAGGRDVSGCR